MKKIYLFFIVFFFISSCESMSTNPVVRKSSRSYSNINKVIYSSKKSSENIAYYQQEKVKKNYHKELENSDDFSQDFTDEDAENYGLDNFDKNSTEENFSDLNQSKSGYYKVGQPYEVQGVSYVPEEYDEFEETGIASWYGSEFNGRKTANGEIFDLNIASAAHPTLPLPSLIKVTNLANNKSMVVRVNDRGPFVGDRIIDLSQKAAEILDFKDQGKTEVKIQLLKNETEKMLFDIGYTR